MLRHFRPKLLIKIKERVLPEIFIFIFITGHSFPIYNLYSYITTNFFIYIFINLKWQIRINFSFNIRNERQKIYIYLLLMVNNSSTSTN